MSSAAYYPLDTNVRSQITPDQLAQRRQAAQEHWRRTYLDAGKPVILVGWGSCSVAHGAVQTFFAIRDWLAANHVDAVLRRTGCIGPDYAEPLVDIIMPNGPRIAYHNMTADRVGDLLEAVLRRNDVSKDLAFCVFDKEEFNNSTQGYQGIPAAKDLDQFRLQNRIIMRNMGYVDPESLDDYLARGGFNMLQQAVAGMKPEDIIKTITDSNLRGRGGAGFPAGIKWDGARKARRTPKYVICNAHEGEPNVFKDRRLLESDPFAVLEGLIIQCYAIGTPWAYFYVGDEYPLAIHRTKEAVRLAYAAGLLGENILGSGFSCHVDVQMGGGAYISGEGTALMFGIEGKRAMPRAKVQRSVEAGLFGLPTCVNNVETMINVPYILAKGAEWYTSMGTESSKGTKLFTLMGNIERVCTVELEMGRTMRELVEVCGGGTGKLPFKAIQTGGPSGGCLAEQHLDLPMDFQSLEPAGGTMGSGGYVVYDTSVCIVDMSRYFNRFNRYQSCGKCFPCRIGTQRLTERLSGAAGPTRPDLWRAEVTDVGNVMKATSACGLGIAAPLVTDSLLKYFPDQVDRALASRK